MNNSIFVFLTILIVTGMIYVLYVVVLKIDKKEEELQITPQELLQQISILYKQKKYNIVETLAKKYLEKRPSDDLVRTFFAKSLYNSKKAYDAIEQAKIILKHDYQNFEIKIFLVNCYIDVEKPMKSVSILQEILEYEPDNVVAIKELANIYNQTNQKLSAIKMYKKLEEFLESNQEKAKNKALVAEMHLYFNDFDLAINEYQEILELYPQDISVKKRLTELYKTTLNYEELVKSATEMLQIQDNEVILWAMDTLMDAYMNVENYTKALEFANLIKEHPLSNKVQAEENFAKIAFREGQFDNTIEILKSLIEKEPENIELKKSLTRAYEANNSFELATSLYKKILDDTKAQDIEQVHFELSNLYSDWAMYLFIGNNNDECFNKFVIAMKYYPQNPDIYYKLGNVNKSIKNFNESISQYKKAIELDNKNPMYYEALAEAYEEIGSIHEQKKILLDYLKYDSENAKIYYKLGLIYTFHNDPTNAMYHIKKAIELDKNFIEPRYKLALILEHKGDKEGAIEIYQEILEIEPENEEIANNLKMLKSY